MTLFISPLSLVGSIQTAAVEVLGRVVANACALVLRVIQAEDLPKADQARFADVFDGGEKYGLGCPRVQFRQLRGKLWEVKFNTPSGG